MVRQAMHDDDKVDDAQRREDIGIHLELENRWKRRRNDMMEQKYKR